jgi:type VI secretion system protein VasG
MPEIPLPNLFGKLNAIAFNSLDATAVFCKHRGNPTIELAHWANQLANSEETDFAQILRFFRLDETQLSKDLVKALSQYPRSSTSSVTPSPLIELATKQAWIYATLMFGQSQVRTSHVLIGILKEPTLRSVFYAASGEFKKIDLEVLTGRLFEIISGSPEEGLPATDGSGLAGGSVPGEASQAVKGQDGVGQALAKFSVDLTEKARKGEIDPIVGRDEEIRQVVDVLMRRRQNNPVLVGEAGVGKTAVAEGFALRIASGDVPPSLKEVTLRSLDVGLLQAGASMKGEFEQRLRSVIEEVQKSEKPIILFIDEVHTLIGAGGAAGTGDAANLLKPALARGTLRTIAATTWDEHRKHIEKDPALSRRFQKVYIEEPGEHKAIRMLRGVTSALEKHHRVQILDEAIEAAVRLSMRFIPARQLPDKAVSLLDTASARVALSQHAVPAPVDDIRREIEGLNTELEILRSESEVGIDHKVRITSVEGKLSDCKTRLVQLEEKWAAEKKLVDRILELRATLRAKGEPVDPPKGDEASAKDLNDRAEARDLSRQELRKLQDELVAFQGESPLLFPSVEQGAIASVVADWTGIPVGRMARQRIKDVLDLSNVLEKRVIGQKHALDHVARRIQSSRARLENPDRPIAVFMFVGPSGTGKTETALSLAEALYGGEQNLITINMSEFQEKHTVSTLKGSPPGYVGYGDGGVLTEAVRRRPYSVVLLDEVEKAHPDVHKIFFQVFDKGWMEDSEGRSIDFRNCVIILTSNAAQDVIVNLCKDPELKPDAEGIEKALRVPLTKVFPDALLNRLVVVPYYPISKDIIKSIILLNLARIERRIRENHSLPFTYDPAVLDLIDRRCSELERGARLIESMITNSMLPDIGRELLTRQFEGRTAKRVHISVVAEDFAYSFD